MFRFQRAHVAKYTLIACALLVSSGCWGTLGPGIGIGADDIDTAAAAIRGNRKKAVITVQADDGVSVVNQSTITIGKPGSATQSSDAHPQQEAKPGTFGDLPERNRDGSKK